MTTLPGLYSAAGAGWYLARCLQTFAGEIAVRYPTAYCLGTIGDQTHQGEATASDHNPFVKAPSGLGVVRAIDIAGPDAVLDALQLKFLWMYTARDPRVFPFGYFHRNDVVSNWPPMPIGGTHTDPGDGGHLHISVTQVNGNAPSAAGYVAAIDSTAPWGIDTSEDRDMATPFLYRSPITGGLYVVAADHSSKTNLADVAAWAAMQGDTVNYRQAPAGFDDADLALIPDSNAVLLALDALTSAIKASAGAPSAVTAKEIVQALGAAITKGEPS